jgi:hypothetical protein
MGIFNSKIFNKNIFNCEITVTSETTAGWQWAWLYRKKEEDDKQEVIEEAERILADTYRQIEIEAQQKARRRVYEYQRRRLQEATEKLRQAEADQVKAEIERLIAELESERTAKIESEARAELDRIREQVRIEQAEEEESIAMLMTVIMAGE